jgi:hypothetical protein
LPATIIIIQAFRSRNMTSSYKLVLLFGITLAWYFTWRIILTSNKQSSYNPKTDAKVIRLILTPFLS